jgi:hypothetical protein
MPEFENGPDRDPLERLRRLAASGSARPRHSCRAVARRHRRRVAATLAAVTVVAAIVAGGSLAVAGQLNLTSRTPQPVDSPSPSLPAPTPKKSEKLAPGSRPGPHRAFEGGTGKGGEDNARGRAGSGSPRWTRDPAKQARPTQPAPSPYRPPSYQEPGDPPAGEPPSEEPVEPPTTDPPTTNPPTTDPPTTEPSTDPTPSEEPGDGA